MNDTKKLRVRSYPDNVLDVVAALHADRDRDEPQAAELRPMLDTEGAPVLEANSHPRMAWVGPGFTPLRYRPTGDRIHLNADGVDRVAEIVTQALRERGW